MKIKRYMALLMIVGFSSACAPAYYESVFRDEEVISPKDQLLLKVSIEKRDWKSAYKIANTYPEVKNTFHDIGRIQDAVLVYDDCSQGIKQDLFSCLKSDAQIFNSVPQKTHLGKHTHQFVVDFMAQMQNEMSVSRKAGEKRNLELAKIEQRNRKLRKRNAEQRRLRKEALVAERERTAIRKSKKVKAAEKRNLELAKIEQQNLELRKRDEEQNRLRKETLDTERRQKTIKKVENIRKVEKPKSEQLKRRLHEINWSKQAGEAGIRDEMAVAEVPFNEILLDMIENKDKSYNFGLDISPPNHVVLAHSDPVIQKSLEIILKNIGEVTRKTRLKTRYIFVSYEAGTHNLQYKFKTNEARAYAKKLKAKAPRVAEEYIKSVSIKALDRHKKGK